MFKLPHLAIFYVNSCERNKRYVKLYERYKKDPTHNTYNGSRILIVRKAADKFLSIWNYVHEFYLHYSCMYRSMRTFQTRTFALLSPTRLEVPRAIRTHFLCMRMYIEFIFLLDVHGNTIALRKTCRYKTLYFYCTDNKLAFGSGNHKLAASFSTLL